MQGEPGQVFSRTIVLDIGTMKKAGRFGKYGEQKRRERFKVKQLAKGGTDKEKLNTLKKRRKKDK